LKKWETLNQRIKGAAVLTLLFSLSIQMVSAIGIHYELDKPYYHPGDTGKLSLTSDEDLMIFGVEMNIHGFGVFKFNMTGIPEDRKVGFGPNNTLAYVWKKGETLSVDFRIPPDAKPGEYSYTWSISWPSKMEMKKTDTLRVYAVGEAPPPEPLNPFLLVLIAIPVLLVAYPLVRWKSRKLAKVVGISVIALITLGIVFGGFLFIFLIFNFITAFYPLLLLLILVIVAASIIIRRRGRKREVKGQKPQKLPACPYCGKDFSTLPRDITVCPYCGEELPQRTCLSCGRDLSQLPADIKNCPYCGREVSTPSIEAKPAPAVEVELPAGIKRIRRYAKTTALFGLLVALVSFIIGPLLGGFLASPEPNAPYMFPVLHEYQGTLGNVTLVGILIAVASALVRVVFGRFKRKGGE
jgi:ribosomal protein L32